MSPIKSFYYNNYDPGVSDLNIIFLSAKVQILKKSKGDKKKKKEVTEEIATLELELTNRHAKELAELNPIQVPSNILKFVV